MAGLGAVESGGTGGGAAVEGVNLSWFGDSGRVSVGVVGGVVKDQGGRLLTGVGGDGSTEDRVGLRALRRHKIGVRNLGSGWRRYRRRRGFRGLRRLRLAGLALLLRLLHVRDGGLARLERST